MNSSMKVVQVKVSSVISQKDRY